MLPSRSGRSANWSGLVWPLSILSVSLLISTGPALANPKGGKKSKLTTATPSASPGEQRLTNTPLPVGHEAKGLVLPDFDAEGHLRGKFEAGTARRIDDGHVRFQHLKIMTYTAESRPDLQIDMSTSVLDFKTRIPSTLERSII